MAGDGPRERKRPRLSIWTGKNFRTATIFVFPLDAGLITLDEYLDRTLFYRRQRSRAKNLLSSCMRNRKNFRKRALFSMK